MNAAERLEQDRKAMELRMSGVPLQGVKDHLQFKTLAAAEQAIKRARKASRPIRDPEEVRQLELDRLDRLQQAAWLKATKGDLAAMDRVVQLSVLRMRWSGIAAGAAHGMQDALERSIKATPSIDEEKDQYLLEGARRIAMRVDEAFASGDSMAETKALYLLPHLMNLGRELGMSPEARGVFASNATAPAPPGKKNDLTDFRNRKGIAT